MNPFKQFLAILRKQDPAKHRELLRDPRFQKARRDVATQSREEAHARGAEQALERKRRLVEEGKGSHTLKGIPA